MQSKPAPAPDAGPTAVQGANGIDGGGDGGGGDGGGGGGGGGGSGEEEDTSLLGQLESCIVQPTLARALPLLQLLPPLFERSRRAVRPMRCIAPRAVSPHRARPTPKLETAVSGSAPEPAIGSSSTSRGIERPSSGR